MTAAARPGGDRLRHTRAASLFRDYVRATEHLAGPLGAVPVRDAPACLLQNRIRRAARELATDVEAVLSRAIELALARAADRPAPIYVAGMGGSGSHWLTGMLAEMLPAIDLEEASIPADLGAEIESLPADEQGVAIDCLYMSHASAALTTHTSERLRTIRAINSAVPVIEPRHREWDPDCFAIYLLRDPREQTACFAFRKPGFKARVFPSLSDEEYLAACAAENARNHAATRRSAVRPDFVCRYEELKASATQVLTKLATAMGHPVEPDAAAGAARQHDASLIRDGVLPRKGTLSASEHGDWREETDERQKLVLHSHLVEVVTASSYPADDCTGRPLVLREERAARRLGFDRGGRLGVLFARRQGLGGSPSWTRLGEACGEIAVGPGVDLKLRVHESAGQGSLRSLNALPADALDSLCMAGNVSLDDSLLGACTASLRDLRELDLARTGVTDSSLDTLSGLSRLRGVNLFGSRLTPGGISQLRRSLGPSARVES